MDQDENSPWQYKSDGTPSAGDSSNEESESSAHTRKPLQDVSWEAAEFIEHSHGSGWFAALAAATIALAAVVFLATNGDKIATVIIIVLGIIVGVFARQKPAQAKYEISEDGISVNNKLYKYGDFKSFTIIREGQQLSSVSLFPLKRLMPPVSAYFEPANEEKITKALGNYLPYEDRRLDTVDRLSRRLRL